jgi:hypothetical protein
VITLVVGANGGPSPVTVEEPVDVLTANLSKQQFRDRIREGIVYKVITTIYKNGKPEGEVIITTSSSSDIEMGA